MTHSSTRRICPNCGATMPASAPQGLCPKCLLEEVAATTVQGSGLDTKPEPPTLETLKAAFPHLEIVELIGQGGMGFVFKARQPRLERFVALKILPETLSRDPAFAERFAREGRLLARLSHPNIVSIFDFGQLKGFFYLLMEYVDGVNLRQAMRASRFTAEQALAIVPSICAALQYAHDEGVLHRDIKPENILLDVKGRVKIADFGIAKLVGSEATLTPALSHPMGEGELAAAGATGSDPVQLTAAGKVLGTPSYMAPEQLDTPGEVDQRADIYSLGVVFYELLTGELPRGRFAPPSARTPVSAQVDEVVLRALEKEREKRFQTAGEVRTRVESITAANAIGKDNVPPAAQANPILLRPRSWQLAAFLLLVLSGLMISQFAHFRDFVQTFWWTFRSGLIPAMVLGVSVAALGWIGFELWRRRDWFLALFRPPLVSKDQVAAAPGIGDGQGWLQFICIGAALCWLVTFAWNELSWMMMVARGANHVPTLLYGTAGALLPVALVFYFVRRELRRSDIEAAAAAPEWAPRWIVLMLLFAVVSCLPVLVYGGPAGEMVGQWGFGLVSVLALLTFSRVWRGTALGLSVFSLVMYVVGWIGFAVAASDGQLPAEWSARFTWKHPLLPVLTAHVAGFVVLIVGIVALVLPAARAAFGLKPRHARGPELDHARAA